LPAGALRRRAVRMSWARQSDALRGRFETSIRAVPDMTKF
jgi:hypothetical protein